MDTIDELLAFLELIAPLIKFDADAQLNAQAHVMFRSLKKSQGDAWPPPSSWVISAFNALVDIFYELNEIEEPDLAKIKILSVHFYASLRLPARVLAFEIIDSTAKVNYKVRLLKRLLFLQPVQDPSISLVLQKLNVWLRLEPMREFYEELNCTLDPLPHNSQDYSLVKRYVKNSVCCGHRYKNFSLISVLRVNNDAVNLQFEKYKTLENRQVLWHGSRVENWAGILSSGLQIRPPGVKKSGAVYGEGLYFTNKMLRALNFVDSSRTKRYVLLLSEVALGTSKILKGPQKDGKRYVHDESGGKSKTDYRSCQVEARCFPDSKGNVVDSNGAVWPIGHIGPPRSRPVHHPVFVVFNPHQTRMRYVVVIEQITPGFN